MKKIIFALFALVSIMSSCTNDDIEITQTTTVKVDPSTVLSSFTYEVKPGELTMFDTNYKLRITVLAYNELGILVDENITYCNNYSQIGTSKLNLSEGKYMVYAITDVMNSEIEYWKIEDTQNLATTKIVDQGYIGGKNKILGIATSTINVSSGNSNEFTLKPEAAGSLCLVVWYNIHQFSDVTSYTLQTNKCCDYLQFTTDANSGYSIAEESHNGAFDWRMAYLEPEDYTVNIVYGYYFVFPMKNVGFRFTYNTAESSGNVLIDPAYVTFEKGGEYWFVLDLNDEDQGGLITYAYGIQLNNASKAKSLSPSQKLQDHSIGEYMYLNDLAKIINE